MRIIDAVESFRNNWRRSLQRSFMRLRRWVRSDEQIRPSHTYKDNLSGEYLTIYSVGPQVSITRHDADKRTEWSAPKELVQTALDLGVLEHDTHRCQQCPNPRR